MSIEALLRYADPVISGILDGALSGREVTADDAVELYGASGTDMHLVGMAADRLRRDKAGDAVTFVINRNINFTNVCIKQCGFCAFSRDYRESEGYLLPNAEIVRRAKEAHQMGATEVCIQAGLPPDMKGDLYEAICQDIKKELPEIHIHGFSPEEVLYGASRSGVPVTEYLSRLKDAGVDTLPGTSAEILDQGLRDKISPGRISVKDWEHVIKSAHRIGIKTTSTMMYGHIETIQDRARHIARIREIQKETGGFTEFVPLDFIASEAPMFKHHAHKGIRDGASGSDVLLTHAVARIMLGNIDNIQASWVKEGQKMSQLLLMWGANDLGGTLINESISTSAGSEHGQLLRPREIRRLALEIGRMPVQRDTRYNIVKKLDGGMLDAADTSQFGSYQELAGSDRYRYANPRQVHAASSKQHD